MAQFGLASFLYSAGRECARSPVALWALQDLAAIKLSQPISFLSDRLAFQPVEPLFPANEFLQ